MSTKLPPVGTTVLYALPDGPNEGTQRPALVVGHADAKGALDLEVFAHRLDDGPAYELGNVFRTCVAQGDEPGTWTPLDAPAEKPAPKAKKEK